MAEHTTCIIIRRTSIENHALSRNSIGNHTLSRNCIGNHPYRKSCPQYEQYRKSRPQQEQYRKSRSQQEQHRKSRPQQEQYRKSRPQVLVNVRKQLKNESWQESRVVLTSVNNRNGIKDGIVPNKGTPLTTKPLAPKLRPYTLLLLRITPQNYRFFLWINPRFFLWINLRFFLWFNLKFFLWINLTFFLQINLRFPWNNFCFLLDYF